MTRFATLIGLLLTAMPVAGASDLKIVVILDNSGSMNEWMPGGGTRIEAAQRSLLQVLEQAPEGAEVGVLLLNPVGGEYWLAPPQPVDLPQIRSAVKSLRANGQTPLGASMKRAADALLELREKQRYGVYKLLIVTDGDATDPNLVERYLPQLQAKGLLIDVIGVSMPSQHSLATRASTYRNANDPASLQEAISDVVLGESDMDDSAGQSDFELIAALPGELATASIAALTTPENDPLGGSPQAPAANQNTAASPPPPVANQPWGGAAPPPTPENDSPFTPKLIIVAIIVVILMRAVSSIGKSR